MSPGRFATEVFGKTNWRVEWDKFLLAAEPEGQAAQQRFGRSDAHNSRRMDISKDEVDAFNRLDPAKK